MTPYYEDESVTLYHGDCLDVLPGIATSQVDAVVTDPPYKLGQEYSTSTDADNLLAVSSVWPVARELRRVVASGGLAAVFYDTRILPLALRSFQHAGWKYLRALTLYRRWGQASVVAGWMSTSDFVLIFGAPGAKHVFHGVPAHDTFVKATAESDFVGHPAQKPLALVAGIVTNLTPPGGLVIDPYAGSGTALRAAKDTGRRAIGIEAEERYCEMAAKRLSQGVLDFEGTA